MVTAIVLIDAEPPTIAGLAPELAELPGVAEVYSVAGEYDLVAIVRVRQYEQMAEVVPRRIGSVPGLVRTQTLMAFQYYSRHDLERMWGIGLEAGAAEEEESSGR